MKKVILTILIILTLSIGSIAIATDEPYVTDDDLLYSEKYLVLDGKISKIQPNTTMEEFKKNVEIAKDSDGNEYTLKIYSAQTLKELPEDYNGYIGTGMKIIGSNKQEYTAIVNGDVNGDGVSNQIDLTRIIRHAVKAKDCELTENQAIAVGISLQEEIGSDDLNNFANRLIKNEAIDKKDSSSEKVTMPDVPEIEVSGTIEKDYYVNDVKVKILQKEGAHNVKTTYKIRGSKTQSEKEIKSGDTFTLDKKGTYTITAYTYGIEGERSRAQNIRIKIVEKANYKVEHYLQKADNTYELKEYEEIFSEIDKQVEALAKTYVGYTKETNPNQVLRGTVTKDGKLTLKVYYKLNQYPVLYNLNGGTSEGNPATYTIDSRITLNKPTKKGYTFTGWTGSNGKLPQTDVTITKGNTGERTYTANWKPTTYTISYDLAGGTVEGNPETYNIETDSITLKNPTKPGYSFTGWIDGDYANVYPSVVISKGSVGDKEFTATWRVNTYLITYDLDGGAVIGENPEIYTIEQEVKLINPIKTGYTFIGWTGSNGETPQLDVTIEKGNIENKSFKANWSEIVYTVTYMNGEAEFFKGGVGLGAKTTPPTAIPKKDGFEFSHWSLSENGSPFIFENTTIASNITLYAVFHIKTYTITYNLAGGQLEDGKTNPNAYTMQNDDITINNPVREGYTFTGWTGSNGKVPEKELVITKGNKENKSYTANWSVINYTITYDLADGTVEGNPETYNIETDNITLKNPTKEGFVFKGWINDDTAEMLETIVIPKGSIGDKAYTAKWEKIGVYATLVDGTLTFYNTPQKDGHENIEEKQYTSDELPEWNANKDDITTVNFENTISPTSLDFWFYDCKKLKTITNISNLDTSKVTGMSNTFKGCSSLETLNLSSFNTEKLEYMNNMFDGCSKLTELDLSSFNTQNVDKTVSTNIFNGTTSLEKIYINVEIWSLGNDLLSEDSDASFINKQP